MASFAPARKRPADAAGNAPEAAETRADSKQRFPEPEGAIFDSDEYRPSTLVPWTALLIPLRTIWRSPSVWSTMMKVMAVSVLTAMVLFVVCPHPQEMKPIRFLMICEFLCVIVSFLLGLFITSALGRWYKCINGFLELCDAVRNLQMQLCALGAAEELLAPCVRYAMVSATLVNFQLMYEGLCEEEARDTKANLMKLLRTSDSRNLGRQALSSPDLEKCYLTSPLRWQLEGMWSRGCNVISGYHFAYFEPSGVMWMWVSSLIARMAQDGQIPPMQSATYGRVMELAKSAHRGIRTVRASISIQTPFLYAHVLASLVHINNILNAICLGLVLGTVCSEWLILKKEHPIYKKAVVSRGEVERDLQVWWICCFLCFLGPLLFQALFEISLAIAQPFQSHMARLPVGLLQLTLQDDLNDQIRMARTTPYWKAPCFRGDAAV